MTRISAQSAGLLVQDVLKSSTAATIAGSTSRGLFLFTPSSRVIFLSYETWCSPLTVNIACSQQALREVTTGASVHLSVDAIHIPSANILVDLRSTSNWSAPPTPTIMLSRDQRQIYLREVAALVTAQSNAGFSSLLSTFLTLPAKPALENHDQALLERLYALQQALIARDYTQSSNLASGLLGYGRGLTPSGDDLIAGLLLLLNRWAHIMQTGDDLSNLNTHLTKNAYLRTTALSANIIAAAAAGQADERLIQSLDALFTGQPDSPAAANFLLSYGSSSGVDALLGYAIVLSI
jgi:hypothetical protein